MRTGSWDGTPVRTLTARAVVAGVPLDVDAVTLRSEMTSELPGGAVAVTDGTVSWPQQSVVAATSPHPWGSGGVLPPGTLVNLEVGDGQGQWWQQLVGRVDSNAGSITTAAVESKIVDLIDRLSAPVTHDPLLTIMPPRNGGGPLRRIGLAGSYVSDLAARTAGFYATPPANVHTVLSVPAMGSLWPEVGLCVTASGYGVDSVPLSYPTSWGVAPLGIDATYTLAVSGSALVATACLSGQPAGGWAALSLYTQIDGAGVVLKHNTDDTVSVAALTPTEIELLRVPRLGCPRAAVKVTYNSAGQTLDVVLHLSDGRELTASSSDARFSSTVPMSTAHLYGPGLIGGVLVETQGAGFDSVTTQPTALFRFDNPQRLTAMPTLDGDTSLSLLTDQAQAQGASVWIDSRGRLRWVDRGLLEADPPVTVKTTELDVDNLAWSDDLDYVRAQFTITRRVPALSITDVDNLTLYDSNPSTFTSTQPIETWIDPGADTDWIQPDLTLQKLPNITRGTTVVVGSVQGAALVANTATDDDEAWTTTYNATLEQIGGKYRLVEQLSATPTGGRVVTTRVPSSASNVPAWFRGRNLPLIRGRGRTVWADVSDTLPTNGDGIGTYSHDASWWVQDPDRLEELQQWLADALAEPRPDVTVTIDPDPRLELGDKVTLQDPDRTGLTVDLVLTGIDQDYGSSPSMTLVGRVTRVEQTWTVTDPVSAWQVLLDNWKGTA